MLFLSNIVRQQVQKGGRILTQNASGEDIVTLSRSFEVSSSGCPTNLLKNQAILGSVRERVAPEIVVLAMSRGFGLARLWSLCACSEFCRIERNHQTQLN
uniref:Uncharacterized protein n=1 Tax=Physcomitrium patens TaxID=3218 RepID=A0A2K1IN26_PHYPA|nr:hypothetical protein PHYPA_026997 [Physcomitrium patens]